MKQSVVAISRYHVKVNVELRLIGGVSVVVQHIYAECSETSDQRFCHRAARTHDMAADVVSHCVDVFDMDFGNDEQMPGSHRKGVHKRQCMIGFEYDLCALTFFDNGTERTRHVRQGIRLVCILATSLRDPCATLARWGHRQTR
jgi:hypothetical protein